MSERKEIHVPLKFDDNHEPILRIASECNHPLEYPLVPIDSTIISLDEPLCLPCVLNKTKLSRKEYLLELRVREARVRNFEKQERELIEWQKSLRGKQKVPITQEAIQQAKENDKERINEILRARLDTYNARDELQDWKHEQSKLLGRDVTDNPFAAEHRRIRQASDRAALSAEVTPRVRFAETREEGIPHRDESSYRPQARYIRKEERYYRPGEHAASPGYVHQDTSFASNKMYSEQMSLNARLRDQAQTRTELRNRRVDSFLADNSRQDSSNLFAQLLAKYGNSANSTSNFYTFSTPFGASTVTANAFTRSSTPVEHWAQKWKDAVAAMEPRTPSPPSSEHDGMLSNKYSHDVMPCTFELESDEDADDEDDDDDDDFEMDGMTPSSSFSERAATIPRTRMGTPAPPVMSLEEDVEMSEEEENQRIARIEQLLARYHSA